MRMKIEFIFILIYIQSAFLFPFPIIKNFSPADYGQSQQNWSVIHDDRGIMYFANSAGVLEFDSRTWRLIPLSNRRGAYSLARGPQGRVYVGGEGEIGYIEGHGKGILRFRSVKGQIPLSYRGFQARVIKISVTPRGVIVLTDRFLFVINRERLDRTLSPTVVDLPETAVFTARGHFYTFLYSQDTLYVIDSAGGLLKLIGDQLIRVRGGRYLRAHVMLPFKDGQILIVTTRNGPVIFDPGAESVSGSFTTLKEIDRGFFLDNLITCGILWDDFHIVLGSINKGILFMDSRGGKIYHIHRGSGLQDNHVYGINRDTQGNTWLTLNRGISMVRWEPGKKEKSFPFLAFIRGCQKFSDEALVFGGTFFSRKSGHILSYQPEDQILIFPYNNNAFRFTFASNNYEEIEKTRYRYYLEGLDRGWSNWTDRDSREYTNLYPGKYTLQAEARNFCGKISKKAVYIFRVRPPWHATWWFLAVQVVFIISLLLLSRLIEKTSRVSRFSEYLVIFAVIIIFVYIKSLFSPLIGRYSDGIVFFKVLMTGALAMAFTPAQEFVEKAIDRIVKRKKMRNKEPG